MTKMKFKLAILSFCAMLFLTGCIGTTVYNYPQSSEGEGLLFGIKQRNFS